MTPHSTNRNQQPQTRSHDLAEAADAAVPESSRQAEPILIACPNCDILNNLSPQEHATLLCFRCGAVLHRDKPNSIERSLALTLTALILFVLSNSFPFLAMKSRGMVQETILLSGIRELWQAGLQGLALLVLLTCVLVPLAQMLGLLYILAPLYAGRPPARHAVRVFRLVREVAPWGMMEVFLIGILVALVKLSHSSTIIPGVSVFSFGVLIFAMAAAYSSLDPPLLWDRLDPRR
ncbi:MAG: paraquat-inducible protein A [Desulfobulbus sp.]|nr:paraquat-inducible protein A [Desulfobulbus sp.]